MKRIYLLAIALLTLIGARAQEAQMAAMERIRNDETYKWGEARSASQDEARENAMDDLTSKLKTILVSESSMKDDEFANATTAVTIGALQDIQEILFKDKTEWVCMKYVSEEDLRNAEEERRSLIADLVNYGQEQEKQVNVSEALKYYTWALRMLNTFQDKVTIPTPGGLKDAKAWLMLHLPTMLSKIAFSIPAEKVVDNPADYERYLVNVQATYDGRPVSMLDISYFNGEHQVSPVHIKSGEGVLPFHDLANISAIDLRVVYDYPTEGKNYSPMIEAVYPKRSKRMSFDDRAGFHIPFSMKDMQAAQAVSVPEVTTAPTADAALLAEASETAAPTTDAAATQTADASASALPFDPNCGSEVLFTEPRKTIQRTFIKESQAYVEKMQRVENAIRTRDYESVKDDFTPEGFKIFELMMGSGTVSIAKGKFDYTVEVSGNFAVGKSIPVCVRNGKHVSKENVVFRFDPAGGKIKSVAYALTQRAENDIFREASWSTDSRYALLQFMEDYQTAYALKRLDYIESIFSDNAVIFSGTVNYRAKKRFYEANEIPGKEFKENVTYRKFDKETYMKKLKEDFRRKSYIQLVFEDTFLSKVGNTEGFIDNEVIWIELKQNYYSSNYSDKGYLTLQLNLRPQGSMINVRAWTPHFVPLNEYKAAFPVSIEL